MTSPRVRRQHDSSTRHNGFVCSSRPPPPPRGVGSVRSCFGLFFLSFSPFSLTFPSHIIRHATLPFPSCHAVGAIPPASVRVG